MKKRSLFLIFAIIAAIIASVCSVACSSGNPDENGKKSIKLNRSAIELNVGDTFTLTAELKGFEAEITWESSDKSVAEVDGGKVTAISAGEAFVTASAGGVSASCVVKVAKDTQRPLLSVANVYEDRLTMYRKDEFTLLPEVTYKGEKVNAAYSFESMDESIARVDENGKITAEKLGETEIYLYAVYENFDSTILNKSIRVSVEKFAVFSLETEDKELFAVTELDGKTFNNTLVATPNLVIEEVVITSGFVFSTENADVATVDENGVITGTGYGETKVICRYSYDGKTISVSKNVVVSCAVADKTTENEIILKTDGSANIASFGGVFPTGVGVEKISDVTEEESFMTVREDGSIDFGGKAMTVGERKYRIYNGVYAFNVEVVVADAVISSAEELKRVLLAKEESGSCTEYIVLDRDIENVGEYAHTRTDEFQFSGTLDGRGHVISGIELKDYGLIRQLSPLGVIKNLAVVNAQSTMLNSGTILCCWNYGRISDVFIEGTACGPAGAVVACMGEIENAVVNVQGVGGDYVAGGSFGLLCGLATACVSAKNCYGITAANVAGLYADPAWTGQAKDSVYDSEEAFLKVAPEIVASLGNYFGFADGNLYFGKNAVIKAAKRLNPAGNKHELFSFAKDTDKTDDYAAANIENGYYKVVLPISVGSVSEVKVKGVGIESFSYDDKTKTLKIAVAEIAPLSVGAGEMVVKTPDESYGADVVIADYVITTASELKTVLPHAEANGLVKYIVLGNNIENVGDYANNASGSWFNGTFDGRGYTISDINVTAGSLFTIVSPYATIKNVALIKVTGVSAVVAQTFYGTITDVYVQATLTGAPSGLVVAAADSLSNLGYERDEIIKNVIVDIKATGAWVDGGTFGLITGVATVCAATVTDCFAVSDIKTGLYGTAQWTANEGKDKVFASGAELVAGIGELPKSFCEFWEIKDGKICFGGNVAAE